jgi:hypothetical protein
MSSMSAGMLPMSASQLRLASSAASAGSLMMTGGSGMHVGTGMHMGSGMGSGSAAALQTAAAGLQRRVSTPTNAAALNTARCAGVEINSGENRKLDLVIFRA